MTSFIIWNADPEIFSIGFLHLRYYGLLFALGFIISQQILYHMHKVEGKPLEDVDTLTVYMVIATIIGARLGHVFFYEPAKYLADPIEIFMIQKGGLASHGAAVGILLALWIYSNYSITFQGIKMKIQKMKRENQSYLQVLDRLVILIAMTAVLIRIGNFANSEIEGQPTQSDNGVFFARTISDRLTGPNQYFEKINFAKDREGENYGDFPPVKLLLEFKKGYQEAQVRYHLENDFHTLLATDYYIQKHLAHNNKEPLKYQVVYDGGTWHAIIQSNARVRYPTQLIEAGGYLVIFIFLFMIWRKHKINTPSGRVFGWFLILLFGFRFVVEFIKADQVDFEYGLPLNMGQILSIPLVLIGVGVLIQSFRKKELTE